VRRFRLGGSDDEEKDKAVAACLKKMLNPEADFGEDVDRGIVIEGPHLYLYADVYGSTALDFTRKLEKLRGQHLAHYGRLPLDERLPIHIHLNCGGGLAIDSAAMMDAILSVREQIPVYTYVEGWAASGGTFIAVAGNRRFITKHSFMLIHQLLMDPPFWPQKYEELKDEYTNAEKVMALIKDVYKTYTKVPMKRIDDILKHDIYFTAEECLSFGMVDAII
jgi:ATP-dependent Clp protease protease subunit